MQLVEKCFACNVGFSFYGPMIIFPEEHQTKEIKIRGPQRYKLASVLGPFLISFGWGAHPWTP